ncbi:toxin [Pseudokineococcus basanitobsidens]|uniref:toxin n=1 Tax=Pseudokineococcus basanitobsidens TaxID=1926649 RepID=UPI003BB7F673
MKVHPSALKHGVASADALRAADWPLWVQPLDEDDWPHRELRLGFDRQARLLETVVLVFEGGGEELVIHAMPARRQYWELLP